MINEFLIIMKLFDEYANTIHYKIMIENKILGKF